jgi:Na+/H+-dicarboxylate symporter
MSAAPPAPGFRFPFYLQVLTAMVLGLVAGPLLGENASAFGDLGKLVIQLIKAVATPLLFFVIVSSVSKTEIPAKAGARLVGWAAVNSTIAVGIGLLISNLLKPGTHLSALATVEGSTAAYADKKVDLLATVSSIVPASLVGPFVDNYLLSIILIALLFGFALRRAGHDTGEFKDGVHLLSRFIEGMLGVTQIVMGWVVKLIPVAVFGVVTKSVGEHGYAPLKGLSAYVAAGLLGLALHVAITYQAWIVLFTKRSLREFWREAREPMVSSLGTNSSLATLPVTLKALERLGVSRQASTLGACVGTNFNNDGIILYEGMAVLFVAQASGIDLSLGQQLVASASCMIAAMGVAGIPEAGFISLALVLNTVGLPVELLPLLLTVDWIIARARSVVNVLSDMMLSLLVDRGVTHE